MKFNTAVFYDIENLLKGYGFSDKLMKKLSLKDIFNSIKSHKDIDQIAIQRAYANWSDPRLRFMKKEIVSLGIKPVQIFGFSKGLCKNAADIQLAVDAIDLANTRPAIDNYVIVSGDGGFSALMNKLHEYSKMVIGCGYDKTSNKVLEGVADYFIKLKDPDTLPDSPPTGFKISNPMVHRLSQKISTLNGKRDQEYEFRKVQEIIDWFAHDNQSQQELKDNGLNLSVFKESLNYAIGEINTVKYGQVKFVDFARLACTETPIGVFKQNATGIRLGIRDVGITGFELLEDIKDVNIHSEETYRQILMHNTPIYRLPTEKKLLSKILFKLTEHYPPQQSMQQLIAEIKTFINNEEAEEDIKKTLLSLVTADCFHRTPPNVPLAQQLLDLKPSIFSYEKLTQHFKEKIHTKLSAYLMIEPHDNILSQII